jgi:outer membrane protein TolC
MNRCLLPLCLVLVLAPFAGAQAPDPDPSQAPEPGPAPAAAQVLGQDRLITLEEAVQLGLENNLGLQVDRLDPAFAREEVRANEGYWDPALVGAYDRRHIETPTASSVQRFFGTTTDRTTEDSFVYNAGIRGQLPWGFQYSTGYTMNILHSDSSFYALDPQYLATWRSEVSFPLLRGLYWSTPDFLVRSSRVRQDISDENFRARLIDVISRVEGAYWELAATRALENAARASLQTATDTLDQTKVQYQVGVVSRVAVTQAEAGQAQREFAVIRTSNDAQASQDRLLTAILEPGISDYATTRLRTEDPTFVEYKVDAEASLERARVNRPELAAAQKNVQDAELLEKFSWNQKLPALDVRAGYANDGLAGRQKVPAGTVAESGIPLVAPGPDETFGTADDVIIPLTAEAADLGFPTGRWDADNDFFDASGEHSWWVGGVLSVPLTNETADARYVQSKIALRRAKTNLRIQEQDVVLDVRTAVRELQNSIDGVKAAQRARIASAETLRAEQERLRLGDATPHDVLEFDTLLREAESSEIRALQVYRSAIVALERAQGTLLESTGIRVEDERDRGIVQEFGPQK